MGQQTAQTLPPDSPIGKDGRLRREYVKYMHERLKEREEEWDKRMVAYRFGYDLERQIYNRETPQKLKRAFRVAVDLHRTMSNLPVSEGDDLWRDVVEQLNAALKMGKPRLVHLSCDPDISYEEFLDEWDRMVDQEQWDRKRLVLFHCPGCRRWPKKKLAGSA